VAVGGSAAIHMPKRRTFHKALGMSQFACIAHQFGLALKVVISQTRRVGIHAVRTIAQH
jgi:hypothetical protein